MATVMPLVPRAIQKKILFSIMNDAKITLTKEELESVEHQYLEKPNCVSIAHIRNLFYGCESWDIEDFRASINTLNQTLKNIEAGKY